MSARGRADIPPGYEHISLGWADAVVLARLLPDLREILANGTVYAYAARHADAEPFTGRATAYAVPLPLSGLPVVVRHSRHGGLLAPLTGDRFLAPTRAPKELAIALTLAALGIPTPQIIAYTIYRAGPFLRRSDVITRRIMDGRDLASALITLAAEERRAAALDATAQLLRAMAEAGVHHPDLNVKNIFIAHTGTALTAYVLDVDCARLGVAPRTAWTENLRRLDRSLDKWRHQYGLQLDAGERTRLTNAARLPL